MIDDGRTSELPVGTLLRHNATGALVDYEYSKWYAHGGEVAELVLYHVGRVMAVGEGHYQDTGEVVRVGRVGDVLAYPAHQWQEVGL